MMVAWKVLFQAERERGEIKRRKEYMEQLNLNLVATNIFPNLDPVRDFEGKWHPWQEWYARSSSNDYMGGIRTLQELEPNRSLTQKSFYQGNTDYKRMMDFDSRMIYN